MSLFEVNGNHSDESGDMTDRGDLITAWEDREREKRVNNNKLAILN